MSSLMQAVNATHSFVAEAPCRFRGAEFARRWSLIAALAMLAGCGGGGGDGGTATGRALSADYYPDAQGNAWSYDATSTAAPGVPFFDTVRVNGTQSVLGKATSKFIEDNLENQGPIEEYYFKDARAFTFYGNNDPTDFLSAALAPYDEMVFGVPLSNFTLFNKTGVSLSVDLDGDTVNDKMDASAVVTFNQFEPLVTAAGRFASAAKATATVNITVRYSSGGTAPGFLTITQWRAQNYGLLKETYSANIAGTIINDTLDVRGLRVNNVAAGYFPPQALASGIATAISDELNPGAHAVGTNGTDFLLVSRQQTNIPSISPVSSKWTARVILADGTTQTPFDLLAVDSNTAGEVAIAFDGTNYLVLTGTRIGTPSGIIGQRVSAAGNLVDLDPGISVAPFGINPAVAYDGAGTYLVVYTKANSSSIFGVRVVAATGAVAAEFPIYTNGATIQTNPSVAFDGTNFLVAWASTTGGDPKTTDVLGARVAVSETILNSAIAFATADEEQNYPRVACDALNCLVIWTDRRNFQNQPYNVSPGPGDIYGMRINAGDALLDGLALSGGIPIATGITANAGYPTLAYTGTEYIAAWSRGAFVNNPGGPTGIYAARIATNGTVTLGPSSTGVAVSGPPAAATRLFFVSMAASTNGTMATWLNNNETSGQTKSISGALMYPLIAQ